MKRAGSLKVDPVKLRAWQRRSRRALRARSLRKPDVPRSVRHAVYARANGLCEVCGDRRGEHLHHRRRRSQGGLHTPENLLLVDWQCHAWVHDNPAASAALGYLVRTAA